MKIYICSDIHNQFERFVPDRPVDLILCAGDITNEGNREYHQMNRAKRWLLDLSNYGRVPVFFVPGNHDIGGIDVDSGFLSGTHNLLNGARWEYKKNSTPDAPPYVFRGASMSPCYDMPELATFWDNMTSNFEIERAYYENLAPCDVLVSHCPPSGDLGFCTVNQKDFGSTELRKWIEIHQPKLVVCGHIHDPKERLEMIGKTRVINTARQGHIISV